MNKVKEYFNRKARNYNKERNKGLLGKQISKEAKVVLKMLNVKKGDRILDGGCGAGYYGIRIKALGGNYLGIDISEKMIKETRKKGLKAEVADMQNFKSRKKFDKILVSGSLEFCKNPEKALFNCQKNLKKGGFLVAIAPRPNLFGILYYIFHLSHGFKIKLFTLNEIKYLIKNSDLSIRTISKPNNLVYVICAKKV